MQRSMVPTCAGCPGRKCPRPPSPASCLDVAEQRGHRFPQAGRKPPMRGSAYHDGAGRRVTRQRCRRRRRRCCSAWCASTRSTRRGTSARRRSSSPAYLRDAGLEVELLGRTSQRPNLVARLRGTGDGPTLCLLGHVDTVLADAGGVGARPVVGDVADGVPVGPRRARHEVADRRRGRRRRDARARRAGAARATCWSSSSSTRRPAAPRARSGSAPSTSGQGPRRLPAQRGRRQPSCPFDGRARYDVCVAEKGVFRFKLRTRGVAGHASMPKHRRQRAAQARAAAAGDGRPPAGVRRHRGPRAAEAMLDGLGVTFESCAARTRCSALIVEPMLGVTLAPTRVRPARRST